MVRLASSQPGVEAIRASTQNLPLVDDSARLAYFHLSLHYGDWRGSLDEVARVLRTGGECWIWTMGEQHHRASFLAKWFPSVGDIDAARFPDPPEVTAYLESISGRVDAGIDVETKSMAAIRWRRAVVARFVSTLQLIPADELSQGLADFDAAYPDPDQMVDYVLTFDWIRSRF
jgi:ubiquinone/menaquinone biosynthesis C-methylase UbiE